VIRPFGCCRCEEIISQEAGQPLTLNHGANRRIVPPTVKRRMVMSRHLLLALGLALTTACASTLSGRDSGERLALHVDGFVKAEGVT